MAPEVVKQTGHSSKADIWSVGCLVVEMLTGAHPWPELNQLQAMFQASGPFSACLTLLTRRTDWQARRACSAKRHLARSFQFPTQDIRA